MLFLRKQANLIAVVVLAVIFFVATSSFNFLTQDENYKKWTSPDETANYFFSARFSETGKLAFFDKAAITGDYLLMPRSVRNDFGLIKPVSFLGIILLYGSLASLLGVAIIPYLTPFFAALGIIIFFLLIKRLFSTRVALWSAFLLAFFPVYVYYTVRSMFHNVLFIDLVLAGLYFIVVALGKAGTKGEKFVRWRLPVEAWSGFGAALAGGLFIGLALITRTSEVLWLLPALFLAWLFYARRLGITKLVLFISGAVLPLLSVAYYNQILYNSFWYGGYNEMNRSLDEIAESGREFWNLGREGDWIAYGLNYLERIVDNVFYFGLNVGQSIKMAGHYILEMFPVLVIAAVVGFAILVVQSFFYPKKKYFVLFVAWAVACLFLIFYYGSWQFNDNPDLTRYTIGNSYTRYWLPIYLGLIPLAVFALVRLTKTMFMVSSKETPAFRRYAAFGLQALAVLWFSIWSLNFVLFGSEEGLAHLYYINKAEKINTERVFKLTESNSIIITRYHDKFFWPERRVIMGTFPNDEIFQAATKLVKYYPVYYYNFYFPEEDFNYLNERRLVPYGLQLQLVQRLNSDFGLYKIIKKEEPVVPESEVSGSGLGAEGTILPDNLNSDAQ